MKKVHIWLFIISLLAAVHWTTAQEIVEEEVVDKMAPIGHSEPIKFTSSSFSPVAEDVGSASKV